MESNRNKYLIVLVLLVASGLGGFYLGRGQKEIQIQEKIVTTEGESHIEYRDRIVTVTKIVRPDGTTEETTKTEEKEGTEEKKTKVAEKDKSRTEKSLASNYSLGAMYRLKYGDLTRSALNSVEVTGGRRLIGDVWLDVGATTSDVAVGLSVKW